MTELVSISRKTDEHTLTDFFALRRLAIEYVQRMSGNQWTDYNLHDPGVTIIDQLCFAITDLAYRTNFDIRDILAGQPDYTGEGKDTLFDIDKVMPCRPLCVNDWRKILIDQVDEIQNAWFEPLPRNDKTPGGLYNVLVEAVDDEIDAASEQQLIRKVRNTFLANRNLGEYISEVKLLKPFPVLFTASIEIDEYADSEELLAEILIRVEEQLLRPVTRYTLPGLLEKGMSMSEIFTGPRLKNGFILDDDLLPPVKQVHYSQIIRTILETPGVKSVYAFNIPDNNVRDSNNMVLQLPEGTVPTLSHAMFEQSSVYLNVLKNRVSIVTDDEHVALHFRGVKMSRPRLFMESIEEMRRKYFNPKPGRNRRISHYRSIQYNFPRIYGIGAMGMPESASPRRKAQARQLKAFLTIFEQVLINYLEQLDGVAKLFSLDPKLPSTYFFASPDKKDFPGMDALLRIQLSQDDSGKSATVSGSNIGTAGLYGESNSSYANGLAQIMKSVDPYFKRRDHFYDHLLSRFNISMPAQTIFDADWYHLSDKTLHESVLGIKNVFLRYAPMVTELRGDACDLHIENSISWLEAVIQLWLGILKAKAPEEIGYRALTPPLSKYRIWFKKGTYEINDSQKYVRLVGGEVEHVQVKNFITYDKPDKELEFNETNYGDFINLLTEERVYVDIDMLRNGYILRNYRFGRENPESSLYTIVYRDPDDVLKTRGDYPWKRIGTFEGPQAVVERILEGLAAFIRHLNISTEGLHLVEHLLLRPNTGGEKQYIEFIDRHGEKLLISSDTYESEPERKRLEALILESGGEHHAYLIHVDKKTHRWRFEIIDRNRRVVAHSAIDYPDARSVEHAIELLREHFRRVQEEGFDSRKHTRRYEMPMHKEAPPPEFYDFTVTIALPEWTSRFSNPSFRQQFMQMVRANAPAHLVLHVLWLSPSEMARFEELYINWRRMEAQQHPSRTTAASELSRFIYFYYRTQKNG